MCKGERHSSTVALPKMEASYPLFSLVSVLLILPLFQSLGLPLRQGWSFTADLSLSSPLPLNAFFSPSISLFTPILSSSNFSSDKGFSLGFMSLFGPSNPSPKSIFLTICLGTNKTDSKGRTYAIPVWNWDIKRPLKQVGEGGKVSLGVEASKGVRAGGGGDLVLKDGDGSEVWRVEKVVAMEMQEDGNWVLYNSSNGVAWQSYDNPRDTILQGQRMALGMKAVSNNSLFTMEMMPGGLLLSMDSQGPSPLYYWGFPINTSAVVEYVAMHALDLSPTPSLNLTSTFLSYACLPESIGFTLPYSSLIGQNLTINGGCSNSQWSGYVNSFASTTYNSDFLQLANNGLLEGYSYLRRLGENILVSAQSGTSSCLPPNSCGSYGICNSFLFGTQRTCHCPSVGDNEQLAHVFNAINPSDPTQGCTRASPLQCSDQFNSSLVEIKRSSFSPMHIMYETTYMYHTYPIEECIARCTLNCSCAGFFYHHGSSFCLPFSDTGGLSNISFIFVDAPAFSTYVKVQSVATPNGAAKAHEAMPQMTTLSRPHSGGHIIKPIVYAISAVIAVLIAGLIIVSLRRYRRYVWMVKDPLEVESDMGEEELQEILPMLPVRYPYKELHEVTKGFDKLLGTGAFGCVYEGVLRDGRRVAIKKLDQVSPRMKQFLAEVATMGGISHYNIVRLYGFCSQKSKRLLVYEFMDNGSLDQWLFGKHEERLLSWRIRYDVALGTARGLAYLHGECPQPIIHFDVKPQNILLDKNFVPKLSDFGLSKLVQRESSFVMTGVRGTPGYLAPEWLSHSVVSKKCDVYSYGMVLLELVSGRRNALQSLVGSDEWYFPTWAAVKCQQGKMTELVDKRLEGGFDEEQVKVIMHVAFLCIQKDPNVRPSMGDVCKMLEGVVPTCEETPFPLALEPLSPETDFSLASCSTLREGR